MLDTEEQCSHMRVHFVDVAKGIGMLLVIFHHCIAKSGAEDVAMNIIGSYILSFHMPLFFFCSGYLYRRKDTGSYFAGKVCNLLIPVIVFEAINAAISIVLAVFKWKNPLGILFAGFWFVFAILYVSCVYHLVDKFLQSKVYRPWMATGGHVLVVVGMVLFAFGYSKLAHGSKNTMATAAIGYAFFAVGVFCKSWLTSATEYIKSSRKKRATFVVFGFFLTLILLYSASCNQPILMYINIYGNWLLFLLNAFIGIVSILLLSIAFDQCAWLEFVGRNSLVIMITHFPVYSFIMLILQGIGLQNIATIFITFFATVGLECVIAFLIDKFLPFLTGKRKMI